MIEYENGLKIIKAQSKYLGAESCAGQDARGRILAEDVVSDEHLPPFDNSAMDGFALGAGQQGAIKAGASFKVVASRAAGSVESEVNLDGGSCCQIMTGAVMPGSADCVVPIEKVEILEKNSSGALLRIRINEDVKKNANVRYHGTDVHKGDTILGAGTQLKSAHIAMLAALGKGAVLVQKKPKVALLCSGDELVEDASKMLKAGQIRNSNAPLLSARIEEAGGQLVLNESISDDTAAFDNFLNKAREKGADVIISCGAVSMGEFDFIPEAVKKAGGKIHFHKAAIRPGKPILFASLPAGSPKDMPKNILYFGLPGNPVSSAVGLRFFVTPALRVQLGMEDEVPFELPLLNEFQPHPFLRFFLKAQAHLQDDGKLGASILYGQQSFRIRPLLDANCWISLPAGESPAQIGQLAQVYLPGHLDGLDL